MATSACSAQIPAVKAAPQGFKRVRFNGKNAFLRYRFLLQSGEPVSEEVRVFLNFAVPDERFHIKFIHVTGGNKICGVEWHYSYINRNFVKYNEKNVKNFGEMVKAPGGKDVGHHTCPNCARVVLRLCGKATVKVSSRLCAHCEIKLELPEWYTNPRDDILRGDKDVGVGDGNHGEQRRDVRATPSDIVEAPTKAIAKSEIVDDLRHCGLESDSSEDDTVECTNDSGPYTNHV